MEPFRQILQMYAFPAKYRLQTALLTGKMCIQIPESPLLRGLPSSSAAAHAMCVHSCSTGFCTDNTCPSESTQDPRFRIRTNGSAMHWYHTATALRGSRILSIRTVRCTTDSPRRQQSRCQECSTISNILYHMTTTDGRR